MWSTVKALRLTRLKGEVWRQSSYTALCIPVRQMSQAENVDGYSDWSYEKLVGRVTSLEQQLRELTEKSNLILIELISF